MTSVFVDNPGLLDWMKRIHKLEEKLDGSDTQTFGPYKARGNSYQIKYKASSASWELVREVDDSLAIYLSWRGTIVQLAEAERNTMPKGDFIRMLIVAAIEAGINDRGGLLDTLELAANREAVQQSIDLNVSMDDVSKQFSDSFIKGVLSRGQGSNPAVHLWYLDKNKTYHLHQ